MSDGSSASGRSSCSGSFSTGSTNSIRVEHSEIPKSPNSIVDFRPPISALGTYHSIILISDHQLLESLRSFFLSFFSPPPRPSYLAPRASDPSSIRLEVMFFRNNFEIHVVAKNKFSVFDFDLRYLPNE